MDAPPPEVSTLHAVRVRTRARIDLRGLVQLAGVAAVLVAAALAGGAYSVTSRSTLAVGAWWLLALAAVGGVLAHSSRAGAVAGSALAALAGWTLVSGVWSHDMEDAFLEFVRVTLYLGVFALTSLLVRRATAEWWVDGIALAIVGVAVAALGSRFLPGTFPQSRIGRFEPDWLVRLSYPVESWNGLAALLALGVPLLLRAAAVHRPLAFRMLAVAPLPAIAIAVYLTSSRAGSAAVFLGAALFVLLARGRRLVVAGALAAVGIAAAPAFAFLVKQHQLVNGPMGTPTVAAQGHRAAVVTLAACVVAAAVYGIGVTFMPSALAVPPVLRRVIVVASAVVAVGAMVAIHPVRRFEDFKQYGPSRGSAAQIQGHLISASGRGRWQLWSAAVDEFKAHPWLGGGAGSFGTWWNEHPTLPIYVQDPHSMYMEELGELGVLGLGLLLIVVIGAPLSALVAVRRNGPGVGGTRAAAIASFAVFAFTAAFDWEWKMTVVAVIAFVLLGVLLAPLGRAAMPARAVSRPLRAALAVFALLMVAAQVPSWAGASYLAKSRAAVADSRYIDAVRDAGHARDVEPWAATPYLQMALVAEQAGELEPARVWVADATSRNPSNWTIWLTRVRIDVKLGRIEDARASLRRAETLNPQASIFFGYRKLVAPSG